VINIVNPPDDREKVLKLVRDWVEKAEADLEAAELDLTARGDSLLADACFHAQQCAEKYLKALLVLERVSFPKTHDVSEILNLVPPTVGLKLRKSLVVELSPYAVEVRYPGNWEPIARAEAEAAVEAAKKVREAVRSHLPEQALAG
jgi:HEPN domain-containing protein